jgi:hypothetical protein
MLASWDAGQRLSYITGEFVMRDLDTAELGFVYGAGCSPCAPKRKKSKGSKSKGSKSKGSKSKGSRSKGC